MNGAVERQRLLGVVALAVAVPLPLTGIASPVFVAPFAIVAALVAIARGAVRSLPSWVENLAAPLIVVAVVAAGGLRFGVMRPVVNLTLLVAAVRLFGCGVASRGWSTGGLLTLIGVAGIASSTHPSLVAYLVGLEVLLLVVAARLAALSLAEQGVSGTRSGPSLAAAVGVATLLLSLVLAAAVFVVLPRLRSPFATAPFGGRAVSGFRDAVALHRIGEIKLSRALVMRVSLPDGADVRPEWLRFVGSTVQHYRAGVWAQGRRGARSLRAGAERWVSLDPTLGPGDAIEARFSLEQTGEFMFVPPGAEAIALPMTEVWEGPLGTLRVARGTVPPILYAVKFRADRVVQPPPGDADLELPDGFEWLQPLARRATAGSGNTLAAALSTEAFLRDNYGYSARSDAPLRRDPVDWFLNTSREGHCEFFASSMVLMLRSLGIPARLQAGFAGGEPDGQGGITVRESHAHAWVVAWVGHGSRSRSVREGSTDQWRVFDPTPVEGQPILEPRGAGLPWRVSWQRLEGAWDRWVLTFSLSDQVDFVRGALDLAKSHGSLVAAGSAVALCVAVLLGMLSRRQPADRRRAGEKPAGVSRALTVVIREAQSLGLRGAEAVTPRCFLAETAAAAPQVASELSWLVEQHEQSRYAELGKTSPIAAARSARRIVRLLRAQRRVSARESGRRRQWRGR